MPNAQGFQLVEIIKNDIKMLDYAVSIQDWRNAAYFIQQVIEKSLKLVLMSQGVTDNQLMIHDLTYLILMLNHVGIQVPSNIVSTANKITEWEAKARYDIRFNAKPSDIKGCAKIAKNYFKLVTSN